MAKPTLNRSDRATTPMSAEPFLPRRRTWSSLSRSAETCRGCPLYRNATQTVFGSGPTPAALMLIGESPGDQEDREGEPFVGAAGHLLNEALVAAGIDRDEVYLTNTVKHFKWEPQGKRRLHKKPNVGEIQACRPWLDAELEVVRPQVLVCLGATAAQALLGKAFRITNDRGKVIAWDDRRLIATFHPSAVLRAPDAGQRTLMRRQLLQDLRKAAKLLSSS